MLKSRKLKFWLIIGLLFSSILFAILVPKNPKPGLHSWFTSLAGDWSIVIGETSFEIGPIFDGRDDTYCIFYWRPVGSEGKTAPQVIVDNVVSYNYGNDYIVAKKTTGWSWINIPGKQVYNAETEEEFKALAPPQAITLASQLYEPKPAVTYVSITYLFLAFLIVLLFLAFKFFANRRISRNNSHSTSPDIVINKKFN